MTAETHSIEVDTATFIDTLSILRAATKGAGSLMLSFDGRDLAITRGATTVSVPASGSWPKPISVSVDMVGNLRKRATLLAPVIRIRVERGVLRIGHYAIPCS